MAKWIMLPAMIECLRKDERHRTDQDLKILYFNLRRVECMSSLTDLTVFQLCRQAYYEHHAAHSLLYRRDAVITCWFILITGSVYIDGSVFVPPNSVGKRTNTSNIHPNDCIVLESTEVIVIYYPDSLLNMRPPDLTVPHGLTSDVAIGGGLNDEVSFAGDVDDSDSSVKIGELSIESDSEETCNESYCSVIAHDSIQDVLQKSPSSRTDEDVDAIVDAVQYLKAFSNMTVATRRAICSLMEYHLVEKSGAILHVDGDVIETWNVIFHGVVELQLPDGSTKEIRDSYGIVPGMDKLIQQGSLCTKVDGCQFLRISKTDLNNILHQGVVNIQSIEESGQTVLMSEKRTMNDGLKSGSVVIRGTAEKLTSHLVDDHSAVDSSYVEDFLLTYRTFMSSPNVVTSKLIEWFADINLRNKVIRVVLLWVNNHFRDFEIDSQLSDFLVQFISLLDDQMMEGPCSLLCLTCSSKSHRRSVIVIRADCSSQWPFDVHFGRITTGCGAAFIDKVDCAAKKFGLRYGDQILEANGKMVENACHDQLLGFLHKSTRLKLTVRCNYKGLRESLKNHGCIHMSTARTSNLSGGIMSNSGSAVASDKLTAKRIKSASEQPTTKIYKALQPLFKFTSRQDSHHPDSQNGNVHHSTNGLLRPSSSDPDLSIYSANCNDNQSIKVHFSENCEVSLLVNRDVTVKDVIEEAVEKFGIDNTHSAYMLYEVCTENGNVRKTRLFDHVNDLANRFSKFSRLVLLQSTINTVVDHQSVILQLQSDEVGLQLTENDFELFRNVEPTEFIDDLFDTSLRICYGTPNLTKFAELANKELFWVVTEVCKEFNLSRRAKIIQHFIKIARICQESNNFNSLFAIIGGLGHRSVYRLHNTWDRVPSKYVKMFESMQKLMDPSRNMSNYRNLLNHQLLVSPAIPFYPLVKKDLTFIRDGNDSKIDDLINFEKLRMMAKEIRRICNMSLSFYHKKSLHGNPASPSVMQDSVPSPSLFAASTGASMFATLRKRRSPASQQNARKLFEEAQMVQEVKQYLASLSIITDEDRLTELSDRCEPSASSSAAQHVNSSNVGKKLDPSPTIPRAVTKQQMTPKFGAESSQAVQKLMSLTDKVRPHDSKKNPLPTNPLQSRSGEPIIMHPSSSHRLYSSGQFHAIPLSPESSSVTGQNIFITRQNVGPVVGQNVAGKSSSLDSKQTDKLEVNRQFRKLSDSYEENGAIHTLSTRGTTGRHSYNAESLRWPNAPASAPVSPCHRLRVSPSYDLTGKMADDRRLQVPVASVHSRGQSLDSTYSEEIDIQDDESTDFKDDKHSSTGLRFSRWNWTPQQSDN